MLSPGVRRNQGPWLRLGGAPAPGPRPVDIGRGSGMVLRTVQHLASRQGELAARAKAVSGAG